MKEVEFMDGIHRGIEPCALVVQVRTEIEQKKYVLVETILLYFNWLS